PPCWLPVEVKTAAGFPASAPPIHKSAVPSRKCFIGAAMLPNRVGLPSARPLHSARSAFVQKTAPSGGIGGAVFSVVDATAGTVRNRASKRPCAETPCAKHSASAAVEPCRLK